MADLTDGLVRYEDADGKVLYPPADPLLISPALKEAKMNDGGLYASSRDGPYICWDNTSLSVGLQGAFTWAELAWIARHMAENYRGSK